MTRGSPASVAGLGLGLAVLLVLIVGPPFRPSDGDGGIIPVAPPVRQALSQAGTARVLVELRLPGGAHVAEEALPSAAAMTQRADIAQAQLRVLARIAGKQHRLIHQYQTVPFLALEIDPAALAELEAASLHVTRVHEDALSSPGLAQSVPLVEGDQAWARGFDGTGTVIAILDTGVDTSHPFLAGKVVEEACFSSGASLCPNGQTQQIGPGAGRNCPLSVNGCDHGTHVSGIAAGNGVGAGVAFSGVAKGARIIAVQVFSRFDNPVDCGGGPAPCVLAYTSDMIMGLDHVYSLRAAYNLASVNISIGGGESSTFCDSDPRKPSIDNLRAARIATVISAGNDGLKTAVSKPACISSAVSVGATTKSDAVADFSNVASFMSLFAPGASITSSVPGGAFAVFNGTSMAAPHAAGAWAILRQAAPGATVPEILSALQDTGRLVTDTRSGGSVTRPRIQIAAALNRFAVQTASLAVVRAGAGSGTVTSSPAGITCGATCSASYAVGTAVTLTASPAAGSVFGGWGGGGCSGAGPCTVTVTATTTVTATFDVGTVGTTVIFQDGIEGDTAAWSPQAPWGVTTAAAHSGSRSWTDSPGGNYTDNANVSLVSPTFDLSGFSSVTLTFWHRYDLESSFDFGNVFVTADSGTSFTKLTGFTGTSLGWSQVSLDLSAFAGSPRVQVVFQLLSDVSMTRDGWYIDDVVVSGVRVTSALPGDNRAASIPITGEAFTDTRSTQSYTSAVDDPVHSCTGLQDGRTLWYLFTPSRAGTATIQTRGSTYDTVLSAYDASTLAEVPGGCHDDVNLLALDRTSLVHVSMSAGKSYLIEVSAYGGSDGGTLAFSFSLLPQSPAGDDRAAPIVITTETFSDTRQTNGHTADASDPVHSCTGQPDGHTVWYRFTPARAGVATISTRGSDYDTVLSVHGAATLAEVPGGCHDDAADIDLTSVVQVTLLAGTPYLIEVSAYGGSPGGNLSLTLTFPATGVSLTELVAAVLPSSRSVQVGTSVTAFATLINAGAVTATGCRLAPLTSLPASFTFRTTNPATNQVTGTPDTPVDVPGSATQSFVFAFTPAAPIAPTEVRLSFACANSDPAPITPGLNTLLLSASTTPVPDIVALAATVANDGIVNIPGAAGTGVFSVATVNLGAGGPITVSVDTGSASLPVSLSLCRTDPTTGACLAPPGSSVTTQIDANATPTFGVFAMGSGGVPFAPATNRIFVRFKDAGAVPRGATSVAVRTQ